MSKLGKLYSGKLTFRWLENGPGMKMHIYIYPIERWRCFIAMATGRYFNIGPHISPVLWVLAALGFSWLLLLLPDEAMGNQADSTVGYVKIINENKRYSHSTWQSKIDKRFNSLNPRNLYGKHSGRIIFDFLFEETNAHNVDGSEILHYLAYIDIFIYIKHCKKWDKLSINWCRISSINSITCQKDTHLLASNPCEKTGTNRESLQIFHPKNSKETTITHLLVSIPKNDDHIEN